ncbi:MAG: hypothetical protein OXC55_02365 [Chloroflexi bacterium]|nr:hypothetical protein [Chloroflexota bacterium]
MPRPLLIFIVAVVAFVLVTVASCTFLVTSGADESSTAFKIYWAILAIPLESLVTGAILGSIVGLVVLAAMKVIKGSAYSVNHAKLFGWSIGVCVVIYLLRSYVNFFGFG